MQMPSPEEQQIAFTRLTQLIDQAASPMEMPPLEEVSDAEREGILWRATRQYIRGEITARRLQEIEDRYSLYARRTVIHAPKIVSYPDNQERKTA